jgi:hypothetical protein
MISWSAPNTRLPLGRWAYIAAKPNECTSTVALGRLRPVKLVAQFAMKVNGLTVITCAQPKANICGILRALLEPLALPRGIEPLFQP